MIKMKKYVWLVSLWLAPTALAQTTYICLIHGKPAYTTVKQDASCKPSKINGISESDRAIFAPPISVASEVALPTEQTTVLTETLDHNDPIAKIWYDYEYGSYDRTPILPPPPPRVLTTQNESHPQGKTTARANVSGSLKTNQRTHVALSRPNHPLIYQPPTTPVLSRREVLSQEIEREQTALKIAQTQLSTAQKRNDTASITKLNNVVRDRQANVQALQRELSR